MQDSEVLTKIIKQFFAAFISSDLGRVELTQIEPLFLSGAKVIKTCGAEPSLYSLNEFILPRQKILTDGTLSGFSENEVSTKHEIFGDIAHSFVLYQKRGVMGGKPFDEKGMKSFQFIRTSQGWKISSLAWDDERPGISVPPKYVSN